MKEHSAVFVLSNCNALQCSYDKAEQQQQQQQQRKAKERRTDWDVPSSNPVLTLLALFFEEVDRTVPPTVLGDRTDREDSDRASLCWLGDPDPPSARA